MTRTTMTRMKRVKVASGRVYFVEEHRNPIKDRILYGLAFVTVPTVGAILMAFAAGLI